MVSFDSAVVGDAFDRSGDGRPVLFVSLCCLAMLLACVRSQSPTNPPEEAQGGLNRGRAPIVREMGKE